jgi:hypothetical protein
MGIFGVIALVVNIVSALARIARAMPMWRARTTTLAVVVAAGLVWWTRTPWPNLVVDAAIAGLFLHSSWAIGALRDLAVA